MTEPSLSSAGDAPVMVRLPQTVEEREMALDLRWRVLRAPWGQPPDAEGVEAGHTTMVIAITAAGLVVGTALLQEETPDSGRIRYMAVEEKWRQSGVGRALVTDLEARARAVGWTGIVLDARSNVAAFYGKLGYEDLGEGKCLFGVIPHRRMRKAWA